MGTNLSSEKKHTQQRANPDRLHAIIGVESSSSVAATIAVRNIPEFLKGVDVTEVELAALSEIYYFSLKREFRQARRALDRSPFPPDFKKYFLEVLRSRNLAPKT